MSSLRIRRLGYALGAEVRGVDLRKPLSKEAVTEIHGAYLEHIILCFPDQPLEREHMHAFCGNFGELDATNLLYRNEPFPGVMLRSNKPVVLEGKQTLGYGGANFWHSDHSFDPNPNTLSFLLAKELPEVGGDTMFASMYAAYDALSPAYKEMLEPLSAVHDYTLGAGYARANEEYRAKVRLQHPPVVHRLIQRHPDTGRKSLYIGDRVRNIHGMTEEESKEILAFLRAHAIRYEFVYRHRWQVDDLLLWDNRCSMHFAVPDFDFSQLRRMMRTSLLGPVTGTLLSEACESGALAVAAR